ncbi:MAG: SOS response-associated peptidase [Elainellaceae cyanobacterium]
MCGRFTLTASGKTISQAFDLNSTPNVEPRYNIAPSQPVLAVTVNGSRQVSTFRWGLVPFWAKDPKIGYRLINARSETVAEKPAFRQAFARRRCIIVADGFYEWQVPAPGKKQKQPFYFYLQNRQPFGFAGLWEQWHSPNGEIVLSCTILTGAASGVTESVHHRMPLVVGHQDYGAWLDPGRSPLELQALIASFHAENWVAHPVSRLVNDPRHDQPDCIKPDVAILDDLSE